MYFLVALTGIIQCKFENIGNPLREDLTLRNHILVEAKDMACAPLQEKLSETTDEEEVKQIKAQITEVRYVLMN